MQEMEQQVREYSDSLSTSKEQLTQIQEGYENLQVHRTAAVFGTSSKHMQSPRLSQSKQVEHKFLSPCS